jgi:hypothetical protein
MKTVDVTVIAHGSLTRSISVEVADDADQKATLEAADRKLSRLDDANELNQPGEWSAHFIEPGTAHIDTHEPIRVANVAEDVDGALRITPE